MHFLPNYIIFKKNHYQLVAQYSFLFAVRFPTCFGQIYWTSSGSDIQRCSNWKLSHVGTTVFVSANINPLQTKRKLLYLKTQFVPRSKHFLLTHDCLQCKIKISATTFCVQISMFSALSSYVVSFYVPISSLLSTENVQVHVNEISKNFDITELQKNWCGSRSESHVKLHNALENQDREDKVQSVG